MKVFVAGATGVIGRRVIARALADGLTVTAVARSREKADWLRAQGVDAVEVDVFDGDALRAAVGGHDAVVNVATHIPSSTRAVLRSAWRENDRLRTQGAANLAAAAAAGGATRYVQESIAFLYADGGEAWLDEDAPLEPVDVTRSALAAEEQAERFSGGARSGVALRFAQFVAPDSGHVRDLLALARRGVLAVVGDHDGYQSSVHADDAAAAVLAALDAPAGVYNVVEDEPATRREHAQALGEALGRKVRLPPAPLGRLGQFEVRARSHRLSNRRLRAATGWRPGHPALVREWAELAAAVERGESA